MYGKGISLDKAELLSVLVEALLYGFSLLMFGGTIWALLAQRCTRHVNRKILTVACLLLVVSTAHFVIDIIRVMEAFVSYRKNYPGGPSFYLADVSQWTFVSRHYVFTMQTLLGDGVVLYRCYVAWQSKSVMVLPLLLWCAIGVTGIGAAYTARHTQERGVFQGQLLAWLASFWASALATNLLTTVLLACRIWYIDQKARRLHGAGKTQLRPMLHVIIDAGVIYSISLLAALVSFICQSNFQYAMVTPIVSITFYMVIIRVGWANRAKQTSVPLGSVQSDDVHGRMRIHVTTLTESKVEHCPLPMPVQMGRESRNDKIEFISEEA